VTRHRYGISALVSLTSLRGEASSVWRNATGAKGYIVTVVITIIIIIIVITFAIIIIKNESLWINVNYFVVIHQPLTSKLFLVRVN